MRKQLIACILLGALAGSPALAEKPDGAGGKGQGQGQAQGQGQGQGQSHGKGRGGPDGSAGRDQAGRSAAPSVAFQFGDGERSAVRDYYSRPVGGSCPPGLAKKNNGCQPPGQAKKWVVGRALPRDVVYYELPPELVVRLPAPPASHRYVRVAGDILLIAVGSGMVIDAIQDLGRL